MGRILGEVVFIKQGLHDRGKRFLMRSSLPFFIPIINIIVVIILSVIIIDLTILILIFNFLGRHFDLTCCWGLALV